MHQVPKHYQQHQQTTCTRCETYLNCVKTIRIFDREHRSRRVFGALLCLRQIPTALGFRVDLLYQVYKIHSMYSSQRLMAVKVVVVVEMGKTRQRKHIKLVFNSSSIQQCIKSRMAAASPLYFTFHFFRHFFNGFNTNVDGRGWIKFVFAC